MGIPRSAAMLAACQKSHPSTTLPSLEIEMSDLFTGEPDPHELTLTASLSGFRADGWDLDGVIADGTDAEGGPIRIHVSNSAMIAYGLDACADAVERFVNATLPTKVRLAAAVEMGMWGTFEVVSTPETGPRVIAPEQPSVAELLAA